MTQESKNAFRIRLGAVALALSGALFVLFPVVRPFSDESSLRGAQAFASTSWVLSHALGMGAFVLLTLGFLGVYIRLQETRAERRAFWALVLSWIGAGMTLPFFGAEAFSLQVVGQEALNQNNPAILDLVNSVRFGPGIIFAISGLLLVGVAAIVVASAVWQSGSLTRWSGVPLAIGLAVYIPQLQGNPSFQPIRIADGLLIAMGCVWMAWGMSKERDRVTTHLGMRGTALRVGLRDGVHIASPDCEFRRDHPGSSTHTQLFVQEYHASRLAPAIAAIGITVLLSPQC